MSLSAPLIHLQHTTSTNDELRRRWHSRGRQPLAPLTAILADFQSQGRGRMQRGWIVPAKKGLLMSVLIHTSASRTTWVPLAAALAVADVLDARMPTSTDVKWPNDVLVDGKKIAGILTEHLGQTGSEQVLAVGIGVNLRQTADELPPVPATSLALEGGAGNPAELAHLIRHRLAELLGAGDLPDRYGARCISARSQVEVRLPGGAAIQGRGVGIDDSGGLLIETSTGHVQSILAGDVHLISYPTPVGGPQ